MNFKLYNSICRSTFVNLNHKWKSIELLCVLNKIGKLTTGEADECHTLFLVLQFVLAASYTSEHIATLALAVILIELKSKFIQNVYLLQMKFVWKCINLRMLHLKSAKLMCDRCNLIYSNLSNYSQIYTDKFPCVVNAILVKPHRKMYCLKGASEKSWKWCVLTVIVFSSVNTGAVLDLLPYFVVWLIFCSLIYILMSFRWERCWFATFLVPICRLSESF